MSLVTAARPVPSHIDKIGGAFPRCRRIVMMRQAERDILFGQQSQDARRVPARMMWCETVTTFLRKQFEERCETVGVGVKIRWQLKQDRPGLFTEQQQAVLEQFKAVDRVR